MKTYFGYFGFGYGYGYYTQQDNVSRYTVWVRVRYPDPNPIVNFFKKECMIRLVENFFSKIIFILIVLFITCLLNLNKI